MTRRHRTAKPVYVNALQRAIESASKLPKSDQEALKRIVTHAVTEFCRGVNCSAHWRDMADALNVAEELARIGIVSDAASKKRIADALAVLGCVIERYSSIASWTLYPAEMLDLRDGLWMHRVQLEHCSLGEYDRAKETVARRTRQALAGNASPGTTVLELPCKQSKT